MTISKRLLQRAQRCFPYYGPRVVCCPLAILDLDSTTVILDLVLRIVIFDLASRTVILELALRRQMVVIP